MTKLEDKLKELKFKSMYEYNEPASRYTVWRLNDDEAIAQIIQVFKDEGWVTPENAKKVQEMVNSMANLANGAFQLPTVQYVKPNKAMTKSQNLMTGQEWYDRFEKVLTEGVEMLADEPPEMRKFIIMIVDLIRKVAKEASGL